MYAARQRILVMLGGSALLSSVVMFFGFHIFAGDPFYVGKCGENLRTHADVRNVICHGFHILEVIDFQHSFAHREHCKGLQAPVSHEPCHFKRIRATPQLRLSIDEVADDFEPSLAGTNAISALKSKAEQRDSRVDITFRTDGVGNR